MWISGGSSIPEVLASKYRTYKVLGISSPRLGREAIATKAIKKVFKVVILYFLYVKEFG